MIKPGPFRVPLVKSKCDKAGTKHECFAMHQRACAVCGDIGLICEYYVVSGVRLADGHAHVCELCMSTVLDTLIDFLRAAERRNSDMLTRSLRVAQ